MTGNQCIYEGNQCISIFRIYETTNASTYDTLQPTYVHREHAMSPQRLSPQSGHPAFPSYTELRATMLLRQIPQPPPPLQTWPIDHNYLQFQLSPTMSVLETAQFTRTHGPVYNLLTLYTVHTGPLPCLQTNSDVRGAIVNELRRDHVRHNYPGVIDVTSDARFEPREFRCLLQAALCCQANTQVACFPPVSSISCGRMSMMPHKNVLIMPTSVWTPPK